MCKFFMYTYGIGMRKRITARTTPYLRQCFEGILVLKGNLGEGYPVLILNYVEK